ncbi:MAG TPA: ribonuclease Z [Bacteroidales bacterium]|mgnify:CR=1 FL=1|nr:ribonuclease Z [Bacteroidales bacterium]
MIPFQITFLGSGSAVPSLHRAATSQLLRYDNRTILIDCAEGTQLIMQRMHISPLKLEKVLISHLHGDHYFGLIGLLNTMHLIGRTMPIGIYGPAALFNIIQLQLEAAETILRFPIHFHPITLNDHQLVFADEQLKCHAFPVQHRIPTWGFRFDEQAGPRNIRQEAIDEFGLSIEQIRSIKQGADLVLPDGRILANHMLISEPRKPRSYAYCTDTSFFPDVVPHIRGVDLLYHEATFAAGMQAEAQATWHSTTADAARIASMAGAQKLVIGHFSSRYKDVAPLVEEAAEIFAETIAASDGLTVSIE